MAVFVIILITASFIVATIILVRNRAKIKGELEQAIAAKVKMNAEIYEEIDCSQIPVSPVDTNINIAYSEITPKTQ